MDEKRIIEVTETASESVPADYVKVSVTAVKTDKNYKIATEGADMLAQKVLGAMSKIGDVDIRAKGVNVSAQHDRNDYSKITGYRAQAAFSVEFGLDTKLLGKALDVLGDSGCEFKLSYSLKTNEKSDKLIARAVEAARAKAEVIAHAAGVKLGALVKAEYGGGGGAPVMYARAAVGGMAETEPESITLSETVACAFGIE